MHIGSLRVHVGIEDDKVLGDSVNTVDTSRVGSSDGDDDCVDEVGTIEEPLGEAEETRAGEMLVVE